MTSRIYIDIVGLGEDEARERLLEGIKEGRIVPDSVAFPGASTKPPAPQSPPPAPSPQSFPGQSSSAVTVWQEKLEFLREQEPLAVSAEQKFTIKKQIQEAERKIRELAR